jgi:hypothetical protein
MNKKFLTAAAVFLMALAAAFLTFGNELAKLAQEEPVAGAGGSPGGAGTSGRGGSPAGAGAPSVAGRGGAGASGSAAGSAGSVGGAGASAAGQGGTGVSGSASSSGLASRLGVNTWYLAPTWGFGTPFVPNVNFAVAASDGSNIWAPGFFSDLAPFSAIRFLEWAGTNGSTVSEWNQRKLPGDPSNGEIYVDGSAGSQGPGLAYEWIFDLCARSGKACWVTLPTRASDDYFAQFAKLAHEKLKFVTLIVEYGNELDGGWFSGTAYTQAQGAALGLPGGDKYRVGASFSTLRTLALGRALLKEYGAEYAQKVRLARCGVASSDLVRSSLTNIYKSSTHNPDGVKIQMLCMSGYFGSGRDGATYTAAQAKADIDNLLTGEDGVSTYKAIQAQFSIPMLGMYEGGQHVLRNSAQFVARADAAEAYTYWLDRMAPNFDVFMHYTDSSTATNAEGQSTWGLKQRIGGSETVRSAAVRAWALKNR